MVKDRLKKRKNAYEKYQDQESNKKLGYFDAKKVMDGECSPEDIKN